MAKRLLMVMLFVGALGAASLVAPKSAEARGCHRGGFYSYGYAPVYGSYYGGGFYAPRQAFYGPSFYHQRSFYRGGGVGIYGGHRGGLYIGW